MVVIPIITTLGIPICNITTNKIIMAAVEVVEIIIREEVMEEAKARITTNIKWKEVTSTTTIMAMEDKCNSKATLTEVMLHNSLII